MNEGFTADTIWYETLRHISIDGEVSSPRGMKIKELIALKSIVAMQYPIVTFDNRRLSYSFAAAEALWILEGRNSVRDLLPYAPSYAKFSDNGIFMQGAYGPRVTEQLQYVIECLCHDTDSRQAVIEIWRPAPRESKDVPCTLSLQFLIRDNILHCVATMRSSDTWLGWPYDVFSFSMISLMVIAMLKSVEKKYSFLNLGNLWLTAGSQHIYEKNFAAVGTLIERGSTRRYQPISAAAIDTPEDLMHTLAAIRDNRFTVCPPLFLKEIEEWQS